MVYDTANIKLDKRMLKLLDSDKITAPDIKTELEKRTPPSSIEILIDDEKIILGLKKISYYGEKLINYVEYSRVFGKGFQEELEIIVKYGAPFIKIDISRDYRFKLGRSDEVDFRK